MRSSCSCSLLLLSWKRTLQGLCGHPIHQSSGVLRQTEPDEEKYLGPQQTRCAAVDSTVYVLGVWWAGGWNLQSSELCRQQKANVSMATLRLQMRTLSGPSILFFWSVTVDFTSESRECKTSRVNVGVGVGCVMELGLGLGIGIQIGVM